jgi:radical SAM PhpK family P-methyltransferase
MIDCLLIGYRDGNIDCELKQNKTNEDKEFNAAVAYLGTFLSRRGFTFEYINYIEDEYPSLINILKRSDVLITGISTTFCTSLESVKEIVTSIRKIKNDVKIIAGGTFIAKLLKDNNYNHQILSRILKSMGADFYINSFQGEATLVNIIKSMKYQLPIDNVTNIYYKSGSDFKYTKTVLEDNSLESNMVDWNLFKNRMKIITPIRTAISCPFHCAFCTHKMIPGKYQYASVEAIEQELDVINQNGNVKTVHFVDDSFNVPINRFKNILQLMIKKKYEFNWYSYLRCQYIDSETAELMKNSKCSHVLLGIESGSQKMLDIMNKQTTINGLKRGISILNKYGIHSHGMFMLGFPGETDETIKETIDFIEKSLLTSISIQPWYYEQDTPITSKKDIYGITGNHYNWKHNTMDYDTAQKYIEEITGRFANKIKNM